MGRDEQKEEREVLDSIFPDEIIDVSDSEFRISIVLDVDVEDGSEPPSFILRVSYPEAYPDVAPDLDISAPQNAPKFADLDVQEDKIRLLEALQPTIEENLGMAMVFTLVSTLKDGAELLISERRQATQAVKDVEAAKAEEEENRKFHGTAVTRETFLEWRDKFKKDMEEEERRRIEEKEAEDKRKRIAKEERKMTGRELWEKGLAGKFEEDDDEEEGEDAIDAMQKLKVEA